MVAVGEFDVGDAGEFAYGFAIGFEGCARGWECAFEAEGGEGAVDVAAGADALDDLLAEVAALVEVEGAGLGGLLGELAGFLGVADVGAVERGAFEDAEGFEGWGVAGDCAGLW